MKKRIIVILLVWILLLSGSLILHAEEIQDSVLVQVIKAKVITNHGIENIEKDGNIKSVQKLTIRIEEGEYEGEEHEMAYILKQDGDEFVSYQPLKEKNEILVTIQQKDGEISEVSFYSTIKHTTILWMGILLCIAALFLLERKKAIKPFLTYVILMFVSLLFMIIGMNYGWNLMAVASLLSAIITITAVWSRKGVKKEGIIHGICMLIAIAIMGILSWIVYDLLKFADINIKVTQNFVHIKELICSMILFLSCGAANAVDIIFWLIETNNDKFYKKKSNNIIEGQRSLKL